MGKGWQAIARFILKQRIAILVFVVAATIFMWINRGTEMVHDYQKIIPKNDPEYVDYINFKKEFGEDGNVLAVGLRGDLFKLSTFQALYDMTETLGKAPGVKEVLSLTNLQDISMDSRKRRFQMSKVCSRRPSTQAEVDSIRQRISELPFYSGLILNDSMNVTALAVTIEPDRLNSKDKIKIVDGIIAVTEEYCQKAGLQSHYAGLPYVRVYMVKNLPKEMTYFLAGAIAILAFVLFLFFRSILAVLIPLMVVGIVVVWSVGLLGLFGYKISILTALIPSLVTVIGIPNSIYLLTKYHFEFKKTGNKIKSLVLVIQKIGIVTVMTNATTAVGFLVLALTEIRVLREFGIVAGLSVVVTFFISLLLIPIIYSFLPPPAKKHIKHIDNKGLNWVIKFLDNSVRNRRPAIFISTTALIAAGVFGMTKVVPVSYLVDDLPKDDRIYGDLKFLEKNFKGVMPFEIVIDTRERRGLNDLKTLKKINKLQERIQEMPEISRIISIVDIVKFSNQAYYDGSPVQYQLPVRNDFGDIRLAATRSKRDNDYRGLDTTFVDTSLRKARLKGNIQDIGSIRMKGLMAKIQKEIDDLFVDSLVSGDLEKGVTYALRGDDDFSITYAGNTYGVGDEFEAGSDSTFAINAGIGKVDITDDTKITGTTKIFTKGNDYLIRNLLQSLLIAFVVIAILMALLFRSPKMVLVSLIPNFMPLLITAAVMGYFGIALKPSTALIFSVAFGIAVDDTIHYLARYRLARKTGDGVAKAVSNSFKDTGVSMIYTSIILFFGFIIFAFSSYGGTKALGQLTSLTLAVALFSNLLFLPSLLRLLIKDTDPVEEGMIDFEQEKEDVEAMKELISVNENGEDHKDLKKVP